MFLYLLRKYLFDEWRKNREKIYLLPIFFPIEVKVTPAPTPLRRAPVQLTAIKIDFMTFHLTMKVGSLQVVSS